jgi:hypothetical protein
MSDPNKPTSIRRRNEMMEQGSVSESSLIRCRWPEKQRGPGPRLFFSPGTQSAWHKGRRFVLVRVGQGCQSKQPPLLPHTMTSHHRSALDHGHPGRAGVEWPACRPLGSGSPACSPSNSAGPRGTRRAGLPAKAERSVGLCVYSVSTRP